MDNPAATSGDEETVEHIRPIEIGVVVYDPVFNIVLKLVTVTERGTAVWQMLDHAEGDGASED